MTLSVHTGTHIDAPSHFISGGNSVDQIDLDVFFGPCQVVSCEGVPRIDITTLERARIPPGTSRLLLKTDNSRDKWGAVFDESFVGVELEAARWLAKTGIELLGIDYLSIQPYGDTDEIHRALLGKDVVLLEGLCLADVTPGPYVLMCLPMKLEGTEGAPARALLLPEGTPLGV